MYGSIPSEKTEKRLNDPPENKSINDIKLLLLIKLLRSDKSIPEIECVIQVGKTPTWLTNK